MLHTICIINWILVGIILVVTLTRREFSTLFLCIDLSIGSILFIAVFCSLFNFFKEEFMIKLGINGFFMCCWFLFKNFSGIIPIVALIIGAHGSIKDDEERARRNFIEYWKNYK